MKRTFQVTVELPFSDTDVADWKIQQSIASKVETIRMRQPGGYDPFATNTVKTLNVTSIQTVETPAEEQVEEPVGDPLEDLGEAVREIAELWRNRRRKTT